jgi:hypothetical protein
MQRWILLLNQQFPVRYAAWLACAMLFVWGGVRELQGRDGSWTLMLLGASLSLLGVRDMLQSKRAILRNYPVIGHLRFLLEFIRPEMRQYFIESDNEAAPFSRQQRSLVYQRAKGDPDKRPFGTQLDVARRATSGSTIRCHRAGWPRTTSASPSAPSGASPTRPRCSTSRR